MGIGVGVPQARILVSRKTPRGLEPKTGPYVRAGSPRDTCLGFTHMGITLRPPLVVARAQHPPNGTPTKHAQAVEGKEDLAAS
jgi:hypothetical protein